MLGNCCTFVEDKSRGSLAGHVLIDPGDVRLTDGPPGSKTVVKRGRQVPETYAPNGPQVSTSC